jgi:hypothetical protein
VVASPAPANTSEITYIEGPTGDFTINLTGSNINLNENDTLKLDMFCIFASGTASGGHGVQFNGDTANNYNTMTLVRTSSGNVNQPQILFYNSTQVGDVAEFDLWLSTSYDNNPGAGVTGAWKSVRGQGWSRNANSFGSAQGSNISGVWKNSTNNITTMRFFKTATPSGLDFEVGTTIKIQQEQ